MRRFLLGTAVLTMVMAATGCRTTHQIMGHGITRSAKFFGDVRIIGDQANLTVLEGSRVHKLSLLGDGSTVTVMDGATLNRIEFWGNENTVSIPDYLVIRTNEVGANQVIRRPRERAPLSDWPPPVDLPEYEPPRMEPLDTDAGAPQPRPLPDEEPEDSLLPPMEGEDEPALRPPPTAEQEAGSDEPAEPQPLEK